MIHSCTAGCRHNVTVSRSCTARLLISGRIESGRSVRANGRCTLLFPSPLACGRLGGGGCSNGPTVPAQLHRSLHHGRTLHGQGGRCDCNEPRELIGLGPKAALADPTTVVSKPLLESGVIAAVVAHHGGAIG